MSLSASMWAGVSGLLVHGEKMNVLGHNIANVNTIGYKSQRMDFMDLFYKNTFTASGLEQMGMGARVGTILTDFSQGPFEQTGLSTDLAIQGKGFFQVRVPGQDSVYYTRAGDFSFNKDGELTNPQGYIVQGWQVPINSGGPIIATGSTPQTVKTSPILGSGVPKDIKLETWTVLPKETDRITQYVNLSAASTDHSTWDVNPFAALFNTWDGQLVDSSGATIDRQGAPYIAEDAYAYQSSIKIYDDAGVAHTATVYYDKVDKNWSDSTTVSYDNGKPSQTVYEYIVTIDPAEDARMYWDPTGTDPVTGAATGGPVSMQSTKMAGILMTGTMTFGSNGDLVDLSAYTLNGAGSTMPGDKRPLDVVSKPDTNGDVTLQTGHAVYTDPVTGTKTVYNSPTDTIPATQIKDTAFYPDVDTTDTQNELMSWYPADVSNNGLPLMVANFTSVEQANTVRSPSGKDHLIEMDFGITAPKLTTPWMNPDIPLGAPRAAGGPFADGTPDPTDKSTWANYGGLAGIQGQPIIGPDHCRLTGAASSATMLSKQNGYTYGNLMDIAFDQYGVMSGIYSNGVTLPLYQVVLYDFVAPQALRFEGGNLVSATKDSGDPSWGAAGVNGFGSINGFMIEQSNVDLAKEMVHMITTQRGYQANSKVITSVDTMMDTVINMKR